MIVVHIIAPTPALRSGLVALLRTPRLDVDSGSKVSSLSEWFISTGDAREAEVMVLADRRELSALERAPRLPSNYSVVLLTDEPTDAHRLGALGLNGWAALPLHASASELQAAAVAASSGLVVMGFMLARRALPQAGALQSAVPNSQHSLTPREQEVLEFVSRGLPNKTIAARLELSESTVKFHLAGAFAKLGASSRAEAVSIAAREGLITL